MAQTLSRDPEILQAALLGYQTQLTTIQGNIADLTRRLGPRRAAAAGIADPEPKTRRISAEGRERIAAAQRKRWAAKKGPDAPAPLAKKKRRLSPEGRAAIVAATKRRWAAKRKVATMKAAG